MARSETPDKPSPDPQEPNPATRSLADLVVAEMKEWVRRELQLVAINVPEFERRELNP